MSIIAARTQAQYPNATSRVNTQNTFSTASQTLNGDEHTLDNTGYCLLSLDGGGVRGLSTLYILKSIMTRLNYERKKRGLQARKPCEIFDLIGGTSTGGLIAIMLGRLEMDVDECIKAYVKLMKQIFEKRENRSFIGVLGRVKPRFSSKALEEAIAQVLTERGIPVDEKFENGTEPQCKVFVCTKFQKINKITRLRSYTTPYGSSHSPTIVEAALATSAAPTYFSEASIEGSKFVDGAIGANNPSVQVEEEAADIWCEDSARIQPLVKCFVSIGTGNPGVRSVSDKGMKSFLQTLAKEASETEDTKEEWLGRWREHCKNGRAFRFNVKDGLQNVKLAEYEQEELISVAAHGYLGERGTKVDVKTCVENLRTKEYKATPDLERKFQQNPFSTPTNSSTDLPRATPSEIAELLRLGNSHLKAYDRNKTSLLQARHYFSKALHYLPSDTSASPKQVARVYQKLMETSLALSQVSRELTERREHAEEARRYGEAALENVLKVQDGCMVAQVEFLLACVVVWKAYLQARLDGTQPMNHPRRHIMATLLSERLEGLKGFDNLDIELYEAQAGTYLRYLT